jgi:hypothetical protein
MYLNKAQYLEVLDLINSHHKELKEEMVKGFDRINDRVTEIERIVYTHKTIVTVIMTIVTAMVTFFSVFQSYSTKIFLFLLTKFR